jgi:hypothetical protein
MAAVATTAAAGPDGVMATIRPMTDEEGLATLVAQLVDDARGLASAEVALVRARVGERTSAYKNAAIFFVVAGVLALAGLIALLVGLILSLATLIGPGLATAAVVLAVFAIAGVLAIIGKGRLAPAKPQ